MAETTLVPEETAAAPMTEPRDDRPVTFGHRVEALVFDVYLGLSRLLGVDRASAWSGALARALGPLARPVERRARINMKIAFPEVSEPEIDRLIRAAWDNLGRTAAEYAHLDRFRPYETGGRVEMIGGERLKDYAQRDKPVIFVSGHLANWEVMSIAFHRAGLDYAVLYRAANNTLIDQRIIDRRSAVMSVDQIPKDHRGGRRLMKAAKTGRPLAMLVDQKMNDGVASAFFGRPAMTSPTPARLALKFGADVTPVSVERVSGATFRMRVDEPIVFDATGDATADIEALTLKINQAIEGMIRAAPGQWLWFHRRWPKETYQDR
ncbi:MAG: hypothetical protein AAFR11_11480 [Pseudomonadota bacterium]